MPPPAGTDRGNRAGGGLPQPGLFIEEVAVHQHAEYDLARGVAAEPATVRAQIALALEAATMVGGPNLVWGFGPRLWSALAPGGVPRGLHDFAGLTGRGAGSGHDSPATQSDLWLWCQGSRHEAVWESARRARDALAPVASLMRQQWAYKAADNRDPIGFIDGTENPALPEAATTAVIPGGLPGAGGSCVLVQKWVHDLAAFEALSVLEREEVIGRTRDTSIELPERRMPPTSHVSRNTLEEPGGGELKIYRRNTPFASLGEAGTMFIGTSADPTRIDRMLERMFGLADDGLVDRLIEFSRPVSGSYYFVPSLDDLADRLGSP